MCPSDHPSDANAPGQPSADVHWDENGQPVSTRYGEVYFSKSDGLEEIPYVFLQQNSHHTFYIGETGFGTGLNFLAAWQLWEQTATPDRPLHFISVENEPLRKPDLERALALWPELAAFAEALLAIYPQLPTPGFHCFVFAEGRIKLTLIIDDASAGLKQLLASDHPLHRKPFHRGMNAWLLDGFEPAKNASMWQPELFDTVAALSAKGCTLAAFTTAGLVRRELQRVGFQPEKRPGYGRQCHWLAATFAGGPVALAEDMPTDIRKSPYPAPWHVHTLEEVIPEAVVVGAGLAGCHTARALAERGWQVTVLEKSQAAGSGASGNAQGIVYGKLSSDTDGLALFNLASLLYAQRHYGFWWNADPALGQQCGLLQLAYNAREQKIHNRLRTSFGAAEDFLQFLTPAQASEAAGVDIGYSGLFFPQLGWLNPPALCQRLLDHPKINLRCQTEVAALERQAESKTWQLLDAQGKCLAESPNAVIANAWNALDLPETSRLPLKPIRGQVSYFPEERIPLKTVLCSEGYIAPAEHRTDGTLQSFGATFTLHENRPEVLEEDHRKNFKKLTTSLPELAADPGAGETQHLTGRTSFRCTTADYLPLVGPVPDFLPFVETYRPLTKNARALINEPGPYLPGLYINVGHGSRGLAYTPLSAALLAAQMSADVLPLPRDLATALNPARFIIRDLIRNRLGP